MPIGTVPASATAPKVTTVCMNIVSSTVLTPSTLRAFAVEVSSTIVIPHKHG
jgi:hypothetical protein